jgi:hypothetical protein
MSVLEKFLYRIDSPKDLILVIIFGHYHHSYLLFDWLILVSLVCYKGLYQ